ncbi:MAG: hypothetical protein J7K23_03885 [Thermoproteales archaeon]|nr:hypothetical protein [Thermoproteales archaeon]
MKKEKLRQIRQVYGVLVTILVIIAVYSIYQIVGYMLNLIKGSLEFYTFYMQLLVISTFTLAISFILLETFIKSKRD